VTPRLSNYLTKFHANTTGPAQQEPASITQHITTWLSACYNQLLVVQSVIGVGRFTDIGIGRLLCRYRPIVIYYVLWWRWIL